MLTFANNFKETVDSAKPRLLALSESRASGKPYDDKWSIKEILGHLIDSAATNHQRFVRMQEVADIGTLVYSQDHWVRSQRYQNEPWHQLVELWHAYNRHLSHVIANVDPAALNNFCDIGYGEPATLRFVIEDYVRHMQHHLSQIFSDADPRQREEWVARNPSDASESV